MAESERWITTTEAAQRLGVKRASLYAYVSRGLLHSERRPGQQESLFDRAEVDSLAAASRPARAAQPLLRFRGVATGVSSQRDGDLLYRGVPLADVTDLPFDRAAALVLGDPDAATGSLPAVPVPVVRAVVLLPLERRMPVAVQALAGSDPFGPDLSPDLVRSTALALVPRAVVLLGGDDRGGVTDLPRALMRSLAGHDGTPGGRRLLGLMLTALLDHGLTASTVAARVAASTRAGLTHCLCAAYAAMAGPLHGAAPIAAHALLAHGAAPRDVVAEATRRHGTVPGFGHFLYPDGDPRAELVLDALADLRGTTRLRKRLDEVVRVVADGTGRHPNVDLAAAAVLHALDLPAAAGEVLFQVARSYGVAAHVLEEYGETPLRWRGREATG